METRWGKPRAELLPYLRLARERQGISARKLEVKSGVARKTLSDLENQKHGAYKSTIRKLADSLGCESWELTGVNPWIMSDKERKAFARLMESGGIPQTFFSENNGERSDEQVTR